jgi:hypothetical protein
MATSALHLTPLTHPAIAGASPTAVMATGRMKRLSVERAEARRAVDAATESTGGTTAEERDALQQAVVADTTNASTMTKAAARGAAVDAVVARHPVAQAATREAQAAQSGVQEAHMGVQEAHATAKAVQADVQDARDAVQAAQAVERQAWDAALMNEEKTRATEDVAKEAEAALYAAEATLQMAHARNAAHQRHVSACADVQMALHATRVSTSRLEATIAHLKVMRESLGSSLGSARSVRVCLGQSWTTLSASTVAAAVVGGGAEVVNMDQFPVRV